MICLNVALTKPSQAIVMKPWLALNLTTTKWYNVGSVTKLSLWREKIPSRMIWLLHWSSRKPLLITPQLRLMIPGKLKTCLRRQKVDLDPSKTCLNKIEFSSRKPLTKLVSPGRPTLTWWARFKSLDLLRLKQKVLSNLEMILRHLRRPLGRPNCT